MLKEREDSILAIILYIIGASFERCRFNLTVITVNLRHLPLVKSDSGFAKRAGINSSCSYSLTE